MSTYSSLESVIVSAAQMRDIEERLFAAGMPVAALMEKVAGRCSDRIQTLYPSQHRPIGVLVGPGHNGGDALVIARELHLQGYDVILCRPLAKLKDLTAQHARYAEMLGIPCHDSLDPLLSANCQLFIDGLFGFGLERPLEGSLAQLVDHLNETAIAILSLDLPSGIHTDTGAVLGTAVKATQTLCLGLWKPAFFQDRALPYLGRSDRIDLGIPPQAVYSVIGQPAPLQQILPTTVHLPLPRPPVTHKYKEGHLLLICGSRRYAGGAILTALGARASGVGMLSIAVPETLKPLLVSHLPEALTVGCPETDSGAIAQLPPEAADLNQFQAIACGPGLTQDAEPILETILTAPCPLVLDADGLNILANLDPCSRLRDRPAPTILTPHPGEFKRLFPQINDPNGDRLQAARQAAQQCQAIVLYKGSRTVIAAPDGSLQLIGASTPALARGGSGDVLAGLIGGLAAQSPSAPSLVETVATAAWWHAQAGCLAAQERTELGVDAHTLTQYLIPALRQHVL